MGYHIFLIFTDPSYIHGLKGTFFHRIILKYLILIFGWCCTLQLIKAKSQFSSEIEKQNFNHIHLVSYALSS